jgi:hypothetical protein
MRRPPKTCLCSRSASQPDRNLLMADPYAEIRVIADGPIPHRSPLVAARRRAHLVGGDRYLPL